VKINLFCEELSILRIILRIPFFEAECKGTTLKLTSKFFMPVLFTFVAQSIHKIFEELSVLVERAAKIRAILFPTNIFPKKNVKDQRNAGPIRDTADKFF
jgi:hypothetical protein